MDGLDELGCDDEIGFDWGGLLQTAGGVAQYGISAAEQEKKAKEDKANEKKNLDAVVAADAAAAQAMARADASAVTKAPSAMIDAQAAKMAVEAQDRAAAVGLTVEAAKKRAAAADEALRNAMIGAQNAPQDAYKVALAKAWSTVANKAHAGAIVATGSGGMSGLDGLGAESWWTRRVVGPVPGWGVVVGGAGILGAGWLVVKRFVLKR